MSHHDNHEPETLEQTLTADFEAVERTERIVKGSTFRGDSAQKVSTTLQALADLKTAILNNLRQETQGEETSKQD